MFPPYSKPTASAVEDWVDEGKATSPDNNQKLQMVTEVWIEPQFGVIVSDNKALQYLNGLQYFEVPQAVSVLQHIHCFVNFWRHFSYVSVNTISHRFRHLRTMLQAIKVSESCHTM